MQRCEHCTKPFQKSPSKRSKFCSRKCYFDRMAKWIDCAHCGERFRRKHGRDQICCSRSCGNAYGYQRSEKKRTGIVLASKARIAQQRAAIEAKLETMSKWECYQFGVRRSRHTQYTRLVRKGIIEPKFTPRTAQQERSYLQVGWRERKGIA